MPREYLAYWKPATADHEIEKGGTLGHAASNQLARAKVGDTVWIVSILSGELILLGGITVGHVEDFEGAVAVLGSRDLWEAGTHVIAVKGTDQPIQRLPITRLANRLRFESKGKADRLTIEGGRVNPQQLQTMRVLTPDSAAMLREILVRSLGVEEATFTLPDEVSENATFVEGAVHRISVNAYERKERARRLCIEWYGTNCRVCKFNFGAAYGPVAEGYIHVHHVRPLSEIGREYIVDPVKDLCPICPNCHALLHLRNPPYSIEEARSLLAAARG
jgi:hypothetical protein